MFSSSDYEDSLCDSDVDTSSERSNDPSTYESAGFDDDQVRRSIRELVEEDSDEEGSDWSESGEEFVGSWDQFIVPPTAPQRASNKESVTKCGRTMMEPMQQLQQQPLRPPSWLTSVLPVKEETLDWLVADALWSRIAPESYALCLFLQEARQQQQCGLNANNRHPMLGGFYLHTHCWFIINCAVQFAVVRTARRKQLQQEVEHRCSSLVRCGKRHFQRVGCDIDGGNLKSMSCFLCRNVHNNHNQYTTATTRIQKKQKRRTRNLCS